MYSGHLLLRALLLNRTVLSCQCGRWLEVSNLRLDEADNDEEMRKMKNAWLKHARSEAGAA